MYRLTLLYRQTHCHDEQDTNGDPIVTIGVTNALEFTLNVLNIFICVAVFVAKLKCLLYSLRAFRCCVNPVVQRSFVTIIVSCPNGVKGRFWMLD